MSPPITLLSAQLTVCIVLQSLMHDNVAIVVTDSTCNDECLGSYVQPHNHTILRRLVSKNRTNVAIL